MEIVRICPFWARYSVFQNGYIMAHCSDIAWQQRYAMRGEHNEVDKAEYCILGWSRASAEAYPQIIIMDPDDSMDIQLTTIMNREARILLFNTNPGIKNYIENIDWHILEELFLEICNAYPGG